MREAIIPNNATCSSQFGLLGFMGTAAWLGFAVTNEDGESVTVFLYLLAGIFFLSFFAMIPVVVYHALVKPHFPPDDVSRSLETNNSKSDTFDMSSFQGSMGL